MSRPLNVTGTLFHSLTFLLIFLICFVYLCCILLKIKNLVRSSSSDSLNFHFQTLYWISFSKTVLKWLPWDRQIAGAYWYLLGIQNVQQCMANYCTDAEKDLCNPRYLGCPEPTFTGKQVSTDETRLAWAKNPNITNNCLYIGKNYNGDYDFGIYINVVRLTETSLVNRILFPLFWGLMTLR